MDTYKLRLVPLGGVVGVTKNMYLYELYRNDTLQDILIVDCGIGFPKDNELGVDFVIPDVSYLKDKVDKIRAILLTHGHEDHHSALPYHYDALGRPPIYASKLTAYFVENKFRDRAGQSVRVNQIEYDRTYKFGDFEADFIHMTHSIPDTMHMLIKTPIGTFYHGADFKIDLNPPYDSPPDFYKITKAGRDGILCLLSDCLGAERAGYTLSESIVGQTFEDEMRKSRGAFIMTSFSSNISRIRQCMDAAVKFQRKIVFMGRSMKENTEIATKIGYLPYAHDLIVKEEKMSRIPPKNLCLIVAGSQGQYTSALSKIALKQNRFFKIKPGDKVVFSSDPVPGNEDSVYDLIETLTIQGADVIYSDIQEQLHASGHGNQEDLKLLIRFTNPKYFIPIGGDIRHQRQYQRLAVDLGYQGDSVFMLNEGDTVWFTRGSAYRGENIPTQTIYVDAHGVGDVGSEVLKVRQTLSSDGIVVVLLIHRANGELAGRPKIVSRGFVFEPREQKLIEALQSEIERLMKPKGGSTPLIENVKKQITANVEKFLYEKKGRRPLVIVENVQIDN